MIISTYLVRTSTGDLLASSTYWPIEVPWEEVEEFLATRSEIQTASENDFTELPLIIDDDKFMGREVIADVLLVYATDAGEDDRVIAEKLKDGASKIRKRIKKAGITSVIENYEEVIEASVVTKLKIALVGEGGVGKTTTLHLLLGDTPPTQYVPTIALNLETVENIRFGNYSLVLWDFAGQERFRKLWRFYFHGADVIFLVCDSSLRNVIISKDILKLIRRDAPKVPLFAIANKQDKPNVMKPEVVQKILGVPTYPMVAIDKSRRDEMLRILMNAAATYVGVALPDLPTSQLLHFPDRATEEAIAEVDAMARDKEEEELEEEFETIEVVEEVLVDEFGNVIEDAEDYEVVEEVLEEVEDSVEAIFFGSEEAVAEATSDAFEETEPVSAESHEEMVEFDIAVEPAEVTESDPLDLVVETIEEPEPATIDAVSPENEVAEHSAVAAEEVPTELEVVSAEEGGRKMAIELIFEALEADESVTAEIEKVSLEELDTALEALSSDEVVLVNGETDTEPELDEESVRELSMILGEIDKLEDGPSESEELGSVDLEAISEIDAILAQRASQEEPDDS
ncbi:MAG: GTP-binding protein [Candidatus Thorarchaeota archaeon]|nr:MAG: GTP-binding protein [Candidatus Thorarchaeota archaeon]